MSKSKRFLLHEKIFYICTRSHLKKRILVQDQGGAEFQTDGVAVTAIADILRYFEDVKRGPNAEVGPKDFFEMVSKLPLCSLLIVSSETACT